MSINNYAEVKTGVNSSVISIEVRMLIFDAAAQNSNQVTDKMCIKMVKLSVKESTNKQK